MNHRILPLVASAALAVSGLGARADTAPYSVELLNTGTPPPSTAAYRDVNVVQGLKVQALLDGSSPSANQRKIGQVSFMRDWDGDAVLSSQVGQRSGTGTPYTDVLIWLNPTDSAPASANAVDLGSPYFSEWALLAENGAFVMEVSLFSYSSRGIALDPGPGGSAGAN